MSIDKVEEPTQECRKCGKCRPMGDFLRRRSAGRAVPLKATACIACRDAALAYYHKYYSQNPVRKELARARAAAHYDANREQCIKTASEYHARNPHVGRDSSWVWSIKRYGLSAGRYKEILEIQGGKCAICHREHSGGGKSVLSVDHCHATGRVRGLLCHSCNVALGLLRDDPEAILRAAAYLKQPTISEDI